jgi:hypothetical protein
LLRTLLKAAHARAGANLRSFFEWRLAPQAKSSISPFDRCFETQALLLRTLAAETWELKTENWKLETEN